MFQGDGNMNDIPKISIIENIYNRNKKHLGKTALIYMERKITYDEFFRNINMCAKSFEKLGVKKGDIVTLLPINTPEFLYCYYALNMIGAIANSIHPLSSERDIKNYLTEVNQDFVICSDINCKILSKTLEEMNNNGKNIRGIIAPIFNSVPIGIQLKNLRNKELLEKSREFKKNIKIALSTHNFISWNEFVNPINLLRNKFIDYKLNFRGEYNDPALIVHTGGTTGVPKGVILTNKNGVALAQNHIETKELADIINSKTKILGNISMYTAFGFLDNLNVPLTLGICIELEPIYSVQTFIHDICEKKPNIIFTVPSFIEEFKENIENSLNKIDLSFIDVIIIGGQKIPSKNIDNLDKFFSEHQPHKNNKVKINTGYGSSETSAAATCTIFNGCDRKKVGKPFNYVDVRIVDLDTKKELPKGEIGEVVIGGPTVMDGYYNMDEETTKVLYKDDNGDNNYYTGDVGYLDENGELDIIGRVRKMITMYNGYKIASPCIEDLIESLEIIKDCVIVPMRDPIHSKGYVPKAYVSLNNFCDKLIVEKQVKNIVETNMNERNKIYDVVVLDEIPLSKLGKKDFKAIEILDLINSVNKDIKCSLKKSLDSNFDYDCEINNLSNHSDSVILDKLKKVIDEKEESEGVKKEKRKNINYRFVNVKRYVDSELQKKCKGTLKK